MDQRTIVLLIVGAIALFLLVAAVVVGLVIGGVIGAVAGRDGGLQVRTEQPQSMDELRDSYQLETGSLEVNLEDLTLPDDTTDLEASVDTGALTMLVPKDVSVQVETRADNGALSIFGNYSSGEDVQRSYAQRGYPGAARRLSLDLSVDNGAISVQRAE